MAAVALVNWDQGGAGYTVSLVSAEAKVIASAHATWPNGGKCGPVEAGIITPPPVSTSNSRVYYLDSGGIKWLKEDGSSGIAFAGAQAKANTAIGFSVSPDDAQLALNTIDYSATPLTQHLSVTQMGATTLGSEIYSAQSPASAPSAAVWPTGWRSGNLVLAYHRGTCTQGGGPGLGSPTSYHVVSSTSATRLLTIGQDTGAQCGVMGLPTAGGIPCAGFSSGNTQIFSWTGTSNAAFGGSFPGALDPSGNAYVGAVQQGDNAVLTLEMREGGATPLPGTTGNVMWIDGTHVLISDYNPPQVRVYSVSPAQNAVVPSARGDPVARIPASLDS